MTAASRLMPPPISTHLRQINLRQDIGKIADLVEICFADRLDDDGRGYIRQMRAAAANPSMVGTMGSFVHTMRGYVWEEAGKLIGNINLLPVSAGGERACLIVNVAVHPDHRRRGIARALTEKSLAYIRGRGYSSSWLQVDADNTSAQALYTSFGFSEQARRTTWHSSGKSQAVRSDFLVQSHRSADWELQKEWLERLYPPRLHWHLRIKTKLLQPGFSGMIARMTSDIRVRQWSAFKNGQLVGTASWESTNSQADWLWLATDSEWEEGAVLSLLQHARGALRPGRTVAVNYPAGRAGQAFEQAGFHPHQTLIWMQIRFAEG